MTGSLMGLSHAGKDHASGRLRRALRAVPAALIPPLAAALGAPSVASATFGNQYGIAVENGTNYSGASATLTMDYMRVDTPWDLVDNDLWVINGSAWVEAGIIDGSTVGDSSLGTVNSTSSPVMFWGDAYSTSDYQSHFSTTGATPGQQYSDAIQVGGAPRAYKQALSLNGCADWSVNIGGFQGTSRCTFSSANALETGTEASSIPNTHADNKQSNLAYVDGGGAATAGWPNAWFVWTAGNDPSNPANGNPGIEWINYDNELGDWNSCC